MAYVKIIEIKDTNAPILINIADDEANNDSETARRMA